MKPRPSNARGCHLVTGPLLALAAALSTTSPATLLAQSSQSASQNGIVGTWIVQVTVRNCDTNAAIGSATGLVTFHRGGTMSESAVGGAFLAGQRSAGHGTWAGQRGGGYFQRFIAFILFDSAPNIPGMPGYNPALPVSPGFSAGWQTVTHTAHLTDEGHLTSSGTNAFYRSDGTSYRTGCSTAVGTRFN